MPYIERFPYLVDPHVHFRTPGQEYKEDFYTGSCAALAGGVTAVIDMPNNPKLITNLDLLGEKIELAEQSTVCDIGFYLGTVGEEGQNFKECMPYVKGLKIYFDISTGHYVVTDPEKRERIFRNWESDLPILVHAEGAETNKALALAEKFDRNIHICHVSKKGQVDAIRRAKDRRPDKVSAEVTPHHLLIDSIWGVDPGKQMKPVLEGLGHRLALWSGVRDGTLDMVATDHAPHTIEEKLTTRQSGVTGLESSLAVLLTAERAGWLTRPRLIAVIHTNPIERFGLKEQPNTYVEVLRDEPWYIDGIAMQTKCHTTPFQGMTVHDRPYRTVHNGVVVYENGQVLAQPGSGKIL